MRKLRRGCRGLQQQGEQSETSHQSQHSQTKPASQAKMSQPASQEPPGLAVPPVQEEQAQGGHKKEDDHVLSSRAVDPYRLAQLHVGCADVTRGLYCLAVQLLYLLALMGHRCAKHLVEGGYLPYRALRMLHLQGGQAGEGRRQGGQASGHARQCGDESARPLLRLAQHEDATALHPAGRQRRVYS